MKLRLALLCALALALPLTAGAAPSYKAALTFSGHTPKVKGDWFYVVSVTDARGKLVKATVTAQIVDPTGSAHPIQFGCCKAYVTGHPFTGVFGDYVIFPPEARGIRLTFRVIVRGPGGKRVLSTWVKPR